MTAINLRNPVRALMTLMAALALLLTTFVASGATPANAAVPVMTHSKHAAHRTTSSPAEVRIKMRDLWSDHMEWTYATVTAFVSGSPGLEPTMQRLMRNQVDIGNAIRPFYGKKAGDKLTQLLQEHINDAVPVLTSAKAGDTAALNKAVEVWYANARIIADFLASANPHWARKDMRAMMKGHITQTVAYAADQLTGDYAKSIKDYEAAKRHMLMMADQLSDGLVQQFPRKFK